MNFLNVSSAIGVGFGTAALGSQGYEVVTMALEAGFRKFDTAEADWYVVYCELLCCVSSIRHCNTHICIH